MSEDLRQSLMDLLGDRFSSEGGVAVAAPANERELVAVLNVLRQRGGHQGREVRISRQHFTAVGPVDVTSGVATVGAGIQVDRLEQELRAKDLSLGPLSPGMRALDLAALIEGPYAGLRAIPGGRLEPWCLALAAIMPDGLRFVSRASPRSAAGPDLDALFFGGQARFGVLTQVTLRLFNRPRSERVAVYSFADAAHLLAALFAAVAGGCWFRRAQLMRKGDRALLACEVLGSPEGVERDLSTLGNEVFKRGGRSSGQDPGAAHELDEERELTWDQVAAALEGGAKLTLHRLSLETVIAQGASDMGAALSGGGWANSEVLEAALKEADAGALLGGLP